MSDLTPSSAPRPSPVQEEPLLDTVLREAVPEIKLALGDLIDRDNQRAIPDRYARMLPETVLVVTLRPDAAAAVLPIAAELEQELTDSCMRHGSLYDREYRVQMREAAAPGAPLFRVSVSRVDMAGAKPAEPAPPSLAERAATVAAPSAPASISVERDEGTVHAPVRPSAPPPREPAEDPDATRLEGIARPAPAPAAPPAAGGPRFDTGRWTLVVENEDGTERERFPVPAAMTTVGRQTDKSDQRADVLITDAPHVSRRQIALVWAPRGDKDGFTVYNLGLNPLHVAGAEVPGANRGKGELRLEDLMADHTEWVPPDTPMRIGEHGPVLRIVDSAAASGDGPSEPPIDPDATRFG